MVVFSSVLAVLEQLVVLGVDNSFVVLAPAYGVGQQIAVVELLTGQHFFAFV